MTTLMWFRRDLRTRDHPALSAAATAAVLPCFVLDPKLITDVGPVRLGWLAANLHALNADLGGRLCLRLGDAAEVIPRLASEYAVTAVHVSGETEPEGARRDALVRGPCAGKASTGVATGSPYAVSPGRLRTQHGAGIGSSAPIGRRGCIMAGPTRHRQRPVFASCRALPSRPRGTGWSPQRPSAPFRCPRPDRTLPRRNGWSSCGIGGPTIRSTATESIATALRCCRPISPLGCCIPAACWPRSGTRRCRFGSISH